MSETKIVPPEQINRGFTNPADETRYVPQGEFQLVDLEAKAQLDGLVAEWTAAAQSQHSLPEQTAEPTVNGVGLRFKKISLYHGGPIADIKVFRPAEETTIGNGFYATSMPDQAFGYAMERSRDGIREKRSGEVKKATHQPVVYEVVVSDATFVDLRQREAVQAFLAGYADYLETWLERDHPPKLAAHLRLGYAALVQEKIDVIRRGGTPSLQNPGELIPLHLKDVLYNTGDIFTEYVTGLGYDGIIGMEGGEGNYTGAHDSWVIMRRLDELVVTKEVSFDYPEVIDTDARLEHMSKQPKSTRPSEGWWS